MVSRSLGRLAARLVNEARPDQVRARATEFAERVKAEYRAGLEEMAGDGGDGASASGNEGAGADADPSTLDPGTLDADTTAVIDAMRSVDWAHVRSVTGQKSSEAAKAVKDMTAQVDWSKVQPVATSVSTALIAAVASGQLPIGGPLGGRVLRTILNEADLAARVAERYQPPAR